jgi:hypothetical protein
LALIRDVTHRGQLVFNSLQFVIELLSTLTHGLAAARTARRGLKRDEACARILRRGCPKSSLLLPRVEFFDLVRKVIHYSEHATKLVERLPLPNERLDMI